MAATQRLIRSKPTTNQEIPMRTSLSALIATVLFLTGTVHVAAADDHSKGYRWVPVSGTAIHYFSTAIIHSEDFTENGKTQRSTDSIDLDGDLVGRVLYHPVSKIDFGAGTLVNTGYQVFSGTVLGSEPVLILDDEFRFDVNLFTGATTGKVFLRDSIAGPRIRCELEIVGTGFTPEGDGLASYSGRCKMRASK
jgi:hypothetical protein